MKKIKTKNIKKQKSTFVQNEVEHDYKCDQCKKTAVYNLQNWWHLYDIDEAGDFKEIKDWEADTNEFWCEDCYNKEYCKHFLKNNTKSSD